MTTLDKNETCVLGYGVELDFYEDYKDKEEKVEPGSYITPVSTYGDFY